MCLAHDDARLHGRRSRPERPRRQVAGVQGLRSQRTQNEALAQRPQRRGWELVRLLETVVDAASVPFSEIEEREREALCQFNWCYSISERRSNFWNHYEGLHGGRRAREEAESHRCGVQAVVSSCWPR